MDGMSEKKVKSFYYDAPSELLEVREFRGE